MIDLILFAAALQTDPLIDCTQAPFSQAELNECFHKRYQQADRALNAQWPKTVEAARRLDKAMAELRKPAFDRLLNAQRAWLRYRDETCGWVHDGFGGSIAPMNYYACLADMTVARTKELELLSLNPNSGEPL